MLQAGRPVNKPACTTSIAAVSRSPPPTHLLAALRPPALALAPALSPYPCPCLPTWWQRSGMAHSSVLTKRTRCTSMGMDSSSSGSSTCHVVAGVAAQHCRGHGRVGGRVGRGHGRVGEQVGQGSSS